MIPMDIAAAIVCEGYRQEISRKYLLIGVFGGNINIAALPATIPLCIFLEAVPRETKDLQLELRVCLNGEPLEVGARLHVTIAELEPFGLPMGPVPVTLAQPGTLRFEWREPDGSWELIKEFEVRLDPAGPPTGWLG